MNGTSSGAAWRAASSVRAASPIGIRSGNSGFSAASAISAATCSRCDHPGPRAAAFEEFGVGIVGQRVGGHVVECTGTHRAGLEQRRLDAVRRSLDGQRLDQRLQRPFRRRIRRARRQHDATDDAGHEQQLAVAAGAHLRQRGLGDADRADGVEVEQPLQFRQRYGFHGGVEDLGGVDDDDVDITRARECCGNAGVVSDVEGHSLTDVEVGQRAGITRGGYYAVSAAGELLGDGAADPTTGSGDEDR